MIFRFRKNVLAVILALLLPMGFCGCGVVIVAGLGALGGYVISPDTVEGIVGYGEKELFSASTDILSIMGTVSEQSKSSGHLVAMVDGCRVTLDVLPMSKSSTKFRVKARKAFLPKIAIAQDVFAKIMNYLNE